MGFSFLCYGLINLIKVALYMTMGIIGFSSFSGRFDSFDNNNLAYEDEYHMGFCSYCNRMIG